MKYIKFALGAAALCGMVVLLGPTALREASESPISEWVDSGTLQTGISERIELSDLSNAQHVAVREDARRAAVRVHAGDARGSGTYFKIGRYHVVITAQHVVEGAPIVLIEGRNGESVYGEPILQGIETDVAVVLIPELNSRDPLRYRPLTQPRNYDRLVGKKVTYTGFPANHDLMTIDGQVAGYENNHVIIHSYGWPGSSGSGVFDMRGRMIGVVSAVDIGRWSYMIPPQLVEDIVWVAPIWSISEADIQAYLRSRGE